jgi:hypothetical protein
MIDEKKLAKTASDISDELKRLDITEAEDKQTLKSVASARDFSDPKVQRRIADARTRLDMINARRGGLESERQDLETAMKTAFAAEKSRWNILVAGIKSALVYGRIQANLPYWEGDERACRRYFDGPLMFEAPIFYRVDRAFYAGLDADKDALRALKALISHIRCHGNLPWRWIEFGRKTSPAQTSSGMRSGPG